MYVVCVKPPDDHPAEVRVFGPFKDRARAVALRDSVRKGIDSVEVGTDEVCGGYAYLMVLEAPDKLAAKRWAIEGRPGEERVA